jgi:integrase
MDLQKIKEEAEKIKQKQANEKKGWFKRPEVREFRDRPLPLTPEIVQKMADAILAAPSLYKIPEPWNRLLRLRNSALLVLFWSFGKRVNEILKLRVEDADFGQDKASFVFSIEKKAKRHKVCPKCNTKQSLQANFCKNCGSPLSNENIKVFKPPYPIRVVKGKRYLAENEFGGQEFNALLPYIKTWFDERLKLNKDGYLFPPLRNIKGQPIRFDFDSYLSPLQCWKVLKNISSVLAPHLFRYARIKFLLKTTHGNIRLVQRAMDFSSPAPIENYAKSLGLSLEDQEAEKIP